MLVVESGLVLSDPTHARIGYRDVTETYSATSADSAHPARAAKTWTTYERWRGATSPATLTASFTASQIDYIGIGAHTLSRADSYTVQVEVDGQWQTVASGAADDDSAVMVLIMPRQATGVRVTVTWSGTQAPEIGKLAAGQVLVMSRPFYGGHTPAELVRDTERMQNTSERGEWLGASVTLAGRSTQLAWANIRADWYRFYFDPFVGHSKTNPFFVAWNPARFADCVYAYATGDVRPVNQGQRDLITISMDIVAHADNQAGSIPRAQYRSDIDVGRLAAVQMTVPTAAAIGVGRFGAWGMTVPGEADVLVGRFVAVAMTREVV